tara:strand:+ start:15248 stop:16297 length:1050 start_codon:yes stop_codon:yes gene_type:complete
LERSEKREQSIKTDRYIFQSLHKEIFFFGLPVLLTIILFLLPLKTEQWIMGIPFIYIGLQMIDSGHIWPSFIVAFSLKKYKWLLRSIPFFIFSLYVFIGFYYGKLGIYRAHAFLAAIHFVRQQYGFYKYSSNINKPPKPCFQQIEIAALYVITITSLISRMANGSMWMRQYDLIKIPDFFSTPSLVLFCLAVVIYSISILYQWRVYSHFSKSKFIIFSSTTIAWGTIGFTGFPLIALFPLFHDLPYLALVYSYPISAFDKYKSFMAGLFKSYKVIGFIVFLCVTIYFGIRLEGYLFKHFDYGVDPNTSEILLVVFCAIAFLPTTSHYLIDAIIWRKDALPKSILDKTDR